MGKIFGELKLAKAVKSNNDSFKFWRNFNSYFVINRSCCSISVGRQECIWFYSKQRNWKLLPQQNPPKEKEGIEDGSAKNDEAKKNSKSSGGDNEEASASTTTNWLNSTAALHHNSSDRILEIDGADVLVDDLSSLSLSSSSESDVSRNSSKIEIEVEKSICKQKRGACKLGVDT